MWLVLLSLIASFHLTAENFSADIEILNPNITIVDPLIMKVTFTHPENYQVDLNTVQANLLQQTGLSEPPFALVSVDTKENQVIFTLDPQLAGRHHITLLNIPFVSDEETVEVISDIFEVNVTMPEIDPDFRTLTAPLLSLSYREPVEINLSNRIKLLENSILEEREVIRNRSLFRTKRLPWIEILGLAVIALVYVIVQQQRQKAPLPETERHRMQEAKNKAVTSLDELEKRQFPEKGMYDMYYSLLTDIVRGYIEEYYRIKAPALTTQEFFEKMAIHPIFDKKTQKLLKGFLIHADKVKFAHYQPTLKECKNAQHAARRFVI